MYQTTTYNSSCELFSPLATLGETYPSLELEARFFPAETHPEFPASVWLEVVFYLSK